MFKPFRTAAVLGAGVMGSQIAAHLANAGLTVHLLDIPAAEDNKNAIVEAAWKKALKHKPPILYTEKTARRITLGNFDEHLDRLADVDWVIEAVVENLAIKQQLMARIEGVISHEAIVSTNTSGLPVNEIARGLPESFRQRFLGTHFFNPPRYLKLLELIPTEDTDTEVLLRLEWFARLHLGKGVVVAKDTPNFIANRIGIYATMLGIKAFIDEGYTIEEIDTLTGTLIGRPKSGTFRTADLVGLDTLVYVAKNLYPAIPDDESREVFRVPALLNKLVETGSLGAKAGQGFYKKERGQILSLNPQTFAYEPAKPLDLGDLKSLPKLELSERLQALYRDKGRAGKFFRKLMLSILSYSSARIPEITDSLAEIDRAMRWGFGWQLGPFEIWDVLGFKTVINDMQTADIPLADWIKTMIQQHQVAGFYRQDKVYTPNSGYVTLNLPHDELDLNAIKSQSKNVLWQNDEAALLDLGEGVVLYEFRSKGNTLSFKVMEGLAEVLDLLETSDYRGMVIGNSNDNFCGGANLVEIDKLAQSGQLERVADLVRQFQTTLQRIHYFPKPIVAAVRGLALGGGCELVMACPQVVAAAESYIGLVELSVGLIPGAGGIMRLATWAASRAAQETASQIQPFLLRTFETVGMATVANSAYEAQELGFLSPTAKIVINSDRRLYVAKQEVIHLDLEGYVPIPYRDSIMVLGEPGRAALEHGAYVFQQGGYISEYDRFLAQRLAYVLTGGELSAPSLVSEDYLLQLERETFVPLLKEAKTQKRIAHLLKTKKPLRN
ncbi:3-hydroxyacyl-CoA dehydrogenase/enoyl-CoA hydratase family protein [Myxosarcina sp. GI1]|uniref:3-hydroxyacyl-CoA dehydrogenase/enoyl-CoA hydratase family protein n=1 Tax=Myxosarcina sp. GI1 TaxID=1541065 RepID=UPI00056D8383|nr:3-hydroxyacyl-CoA dehydrogenase/enoyl-CoA hydratase family protein [Myxosarcina sp. GI1]